MPAGKIFLENKNFNDLKKEITLFKRSQGIDTYAFNSKMQYTYSTMSQYINGRDISELFHRRLSDVLGYQWDIYADTFLRGVVEPKHMKWLIEC